MFGKAVEYMVQEGVEGNLSDILEYTGGRAGPDFETIGLHAQEIFDITAYLGQASHYARPYGSTVVLILYEGPTTGWP